MRRVPIDFNDIARQSGMHRGKVGFSEVLGWVVLNTSGDPSYPDIAAIDPPPMEEGETFIKIEDGHWVFMTEEERKGK